MTTSSGLQARASPSQRGLPGAPRQGDANTIPVLAVTGLAKAFGGVVAVRDVSFDVRAGRSSR